MHANFTRKMGYHMFVGCVAFAPCGTAGIWTWDREDLSQAPGFTLFSEQLLPQPAAASCSLWLSATCSDVSFSKSSFHRGQIISNCYSAEPRAIECFGFRSIHYLTTVLRLMAVPI